MILERKRNKHKLEKTGNIFYWIDVLACFCFIIHSIKFLTQYLECSGIYLDNWQWNEVLVEKIRAQSKSLWCMSSLQDTYSICEYFVSKSIRLHSKI